MHQILSNVIGNLSCAVKAGSSLGATFAWQHRVGVGLNVNTTIVPQRLSYNAIEMRSMKVRNSRSEVWIPPTVRPCIQEMPHQFDFRPVDGVLNVQ